MTGNVWKDVPIGTIVDSDIKKLATAGELITSDFYPDSVKQACYELRASSIFWDVSSQLENKLIDVGSAGYLLKPNCYAVSIVAEHMRLPANTMGRILTKGRLFSIGVMPVNTYADPGFEGRLGITLYNGSRRYIIIKPGEAIAKIEFVVLPKSVEHPYAGQHGYETQIWPIANHLIANTESSSIKDLIADNSKEIELSFGPRIAKIARELRHYRTVVWLQVFLIAMTFAILLALHDKITLMWSLVVGIVANLVTTIGINLWGSWRR